MNQKEQAAELLRSIAEMYREISQHLGKASAGLDEIAPAEAESSLAEAKKAIDHMLRIEAITHKLAPHLYSREADAVRHRALARASAESAINTLQGRKPS